MGCHCLLQGLFLTQGSNQQLPHWQVDSLPLSHQGRPTPCIFNLSILKPSVCFSFSLLVSVIGLNACIERFWVQASEKGKIKIANWSIIGWESLRTLGEGAGPKTGWKDMRAEDSLRLHLFPGNSTCWLEEVGGNSWSMILLVFVLASAYLRVLFSEKLASWALPVKHEMRDLPARHCFRLAWDATLTTPANRTYLNQPSAIFLNTIWLFLSV